MELKSILKKERQKLKRCENLLKNAKVLYWKKGATIKIIDLYDEKNEDIIKRIEVRHKIRQINKAINHYLVEKLRSKNLDIERYMKNYWDEIVEGFATLHNTYKSENSFQKAFLYDKQSHLYRRFQDCISLDSMKNYLSYLETYLQLLKDMGHEQSLEKTKQIFSKKANMSVKYVEPALPLNWADIYEQIQFLKSKDADAQLWCDRLFIKVKFCLNCCNIVEGKNSVNLIWL